jgi:hypothetical protein
VDRNIATKIVSDFSKASLDAYGSHSYASGYLEAVLVNLLEEVAPHTCMTILAQLDRESKQLEQFTLTKILKEAA